MEIESLSKKEMLDPRNTGVLPDQRINISFTEDEILLGIDLCNTLKKKIDIDDTVESVKKNERILDKIQSLQNKLYEAQTSLWGIKEIKTRKNSIIPNDNIFRKYNHAKVDPILIDGEF